MSKQSLNSGPLEGDDLPPPYTSSAGDTGPPEFSAAPAPSLFTSQLSNLRRIIHDQQATREHAQEEQDNYILALIVPYVEDFISSIPTFDPTPSTVEAILLPSDAIGQEWQLSHEQERGPNEVREVVLVQRQDKLRSDAKRKAESSYGGSQSDSSTTLWWANEAMARRLARSLQPEKVAPEKPAFIPPPESTAARDKKPSLWKLFGKNKEPEPRPTAARMAVTPSRIPSEDVTMTAKAEEVTFRRENDFGVWESTSGWAIVIRVRLLRA